MATPTFTTLQQRYLDLIGDSDGTIDDFGKRNINSAIQDILNKYQFSWDIKTDDITLAAGVATLPSDFNPLWNVVDARIVASSDNDDNIFTQIRPEDRDSYSADDYVFWVTYDTATDTYIFNSKTLTGTVLRSIYLCPIFGQIRLIFVYKKYLLYKEDYNILRDSANAPFYIHILKLRRI